MPDNPERDIEKQLRASAEQRRAEAGAPFDLHEATRRMLQAEVASQYGKPQDRTDATRSWWLVFWPRLAVGTPLAALLIASIIWLSSPPAAKDQSMLASAKARSSPEESKLTASPATASPSGPVSATEKDKTTQLAVTLAMAPQPNLKKERVSESDAVATATSLVAGTEAAAALDTPKPVATIASATGIALADTTARSQDRLEQDSFQVRGGGGFGGGGGRGGFGTPSASGSQAFNESNQSRRRDSREPASLGVPTEGQPLVRQTAIAPTQAPALARGVEETQATRENEAANTLFFRNSVPSPNGGGFARGGGGGGRGGRAPARAPAVPATVVLNSFRFEQTGNDLRIVDEDGSVYVGQIQLPADDALRLKELASPQSQLESRARFVNAGPQAPAIPQAMPVHFNVTGVNRSLSQQVVFTGQLQQAVSLLPPNGQTSAVTLGDSPLLRAQQTSTAFRQYQPTPASNAPLQQRIVGRARLADSRELPVDAFQTQR